MTTKGSKKNWKLKPGFLRKPIWKGKHKPPRKWDVSRAMPRRKQKKRKKKKWKKTLKLSQTHCIWTLSPFVINFQGFIIPFNLSYATHWTSHLIVVTLFMLIRDRKRSHSQERKLFWVNSWGLMVRRSDNLSLALTLSEIHQIRS